MLAATADNAAAEGLAEDVHVGDDFLELAGEHAARAREAGLDFVGDEEDVVLRADFADFLEVALRRNDYSGFALYRLGEECDGVRRDGLFKRLRVAVFNNFESGAVGAVVDTRVGVG